MWCLTDGLDVWHSTGSLPMWGLNVFLLLFGVDVNFG